MVDFITGSEFEVSLDTEKVNFSRLTNIVSSVEYDTYAEGGNNSEVLIFPKHKQSPDTIIFEKGLSVDNSGSFFSSIKEGMSIKNVMIYVKHNGRTVRTLCFDSGLVLSKELSVIDARSNEILIEKMEIAHSGLKEVPVS